jgi:hypothetical protein
MKADKSMNRGSVLTLESRVAPKRSVFRSDEHSF